MRTGFEQLVINAEELEDALIPAREYLFPLIILSCGHGGDSWTGGMIHEVRVAMCPSCRDIMKKHCVNNHSSSMSVIKEAGSTS